MTRGHIYREYEDKQARDADGEAAAARRERIGVVTLADLEALLACHVALSDSETKEIDDADH
jgi:hypothetical protein